MMRFFVDGISSITTQCKKEFGSVALAFMPVILSFPTLAGIWNVGKDCSSSRGSIGNDTNQEVKRSVFGKKVRQNVE
jgi:hypothetical protein